MCWLWISFQSRWENFLSWLCSAGFLGFISSSHLYLCQQLVVCDNTDSLWINRLRRLTVCEMQGAGSHGTSWLVSQNLLLQIFMNIDFTHFLLIFCHSVFFISHTDSILLINMHVVKFLCIVFFFFQLSCLAFLPVPPAFVSQYLLYFCYHNQLLMPLTFSLS